MNKVILMGRLTRDPNVRYTQQNGSQESMCVARYTLAVDRRGARDGQQSADFISCVAFGKNGEFAEKYLKQGTKIVVTGRIQTGSYTNRDGQKVSFYVDTELFIIKQYEEEINFKMLPDEDTDDGYYYKFNEKVLFRTDSKTQMEYLRNGVGGMIIKPNEARRKLDMEDAEGGDVLLANGSIVPLTMAGAAYLKGESEQENTDEPEQPEEETEPDTEQPDTATEPDETDTAEDETDEEGGE